MDLDDLLNEVEAAISTAPNNGHNIGQESNPFNADVETDSSYDFLNNNLNKLEHSKSLEVNFNSNISIHGHRNSQSFNEYSHSSPIDTQSSVNTMKQFTDMYKGNFISDSESPIFNNDTFKVNNEGFQNVRNSEIKVNMNHENANDNLNFSHSNVLSGLDNNTDILDSLLNFEVTENKINHPVEKKMINIDKTAMDTQMEGNIDIEDGMLLNHQLNVSENLLKEKDTRVNPDIDDMKNITQNNSYTTAGIISSPTSGRGSLNSDENDNIDDIFQILSPTESSSDNLNRDNNGPNHAQKKLSDHLYSQGNAANDFSASTEDLKKVKQPSSTPNVQQNFKLLNASNLKKEITLNSNVSGGTSIDDQSKSKKNCSTVYLSGSKDLKFGYCSSSFHKFACSNLRCTQCDFQVLMIKEAKWSTDADYMFLRNNMPSLEKLKEKLIYNPIYCQEESGDSLCDIVLHNEKESIDSGILATKNDNSNNDLPDTSNYVAYGCQCTSKSINSVEKLPPLGMSEIRWCCAGHNVKL